MQSPKHVSVGQTRKSWYSKQATYTILGVRTWENLRARTQNSTPHILPEKPGVYEVWKGEVEDPTSVCLYIGSTTNLFLRVRRNLIAGTGEKKKETHTRRKHILNHMGGVQQAQSLWIRWSECEHYKLVEAFMHEWYQPMFPDLGLEEGWNLNLQLKGQPWGQVAQWLETRSDI